MSNVLPDTPRLSELSQLLQFVFKARAESINQWGRQEHKGDGTHDEVTAESVVTATLDVTGKLALSGQATVTPTSTTASFLLRGDTGQGPTKTVYSLTPTANITITGIDAPEIDFDGQTLLLTNNSTFTITLDHEQTSVVRESARLSCPGSTDFTLTAGGSVLVVWQTSSRRWKVVAFEPNGGTAAGVGAPIFTFTPLHNEPPSSAFATLDTRNNRPVLDFDATTDEEAVFSRVLDASYAGGGLTIEGFVAYTSETVDTRVSRWQAAIERVNLSGLDIDADSFASFKSASCAVPATSGMVVKWTISFTDGAEMDSLAAGEPFRLKIRCDSDGTSGTSNATGDRELVWVHGYET